MKKKLFAYFCALLLLVSAVPAVSALEGESARAADTLSTLGLLTDSSSLDLNAAATRAQATLLLVRLAGAEADAVAAAPVSLFRDAPVSRFPAVIYAARQGWVNGVAANEFRPTADITANAWFSALLRMLGYDDAAGDFTVEGAALFAQHIGLSSRLYSGSMTCGQLFQSAVEALTFSYRDGVTVAQKLVDDGVCSASTVNALGLLDPVLTARQVSDRLTAAVFCIAGYDTDRSSLSGEATRSASGFFISPDGVAVTNCHSINGSIRADAILSTGETYPIESVLWYDQSMDLAVVRVSKTAASGAVTSAFAYLELAGTNEIRAGDTVYTLGNPLGMGLSVSAGIISATARVAASYSLPCIVSNADISQGSSGGALLNAYGHVIGVTAGAFTYGNSMYLAVPVDAVMEQDLSVPGISVMEMTAALLEKK